jgi:hypothetical protein
MTIGGRYNNWGDLTVGSAGNNRILYPGQTGTVNGNGLSYATFGTPDAGMNALVDYIKRHISQGWTTLDKLVFGYLGTSTANKDNPYPQSYLRTVAATAGLSPNSPISAANAQAIAMGISKAEGSSSQLQSSGWGGFGDGVTTPQNTFINSDGSVGIDSAAGHHALADGTTIGADGSLNTPQALPDVASGLTSGIQSFLDKISSATMIERVVFVILGLLLVAAAIFTLAGGNKTVQSIVTTAALHGA